MGKRHQCAVTLDYQERQSPAEQSNHQAFAHKMPEPIGLMIRSVYVKWPVDFPADLELQPVKHLSVSVTNLDKPPSVLSGRLLLSAPNIPLAVDNTGDVSQVSRTEAADSRKAVPEFWPHLAPTLSTGQTKAVRLPPHSLRRAPQFLPNGGGTPSAGVGLPQNFYFSECPRVSEGHLF